MDNNNQYEPPQPSVEPGTTPTPTLAPTPTPTLEPEPASVPPTPEEPPKKKRNLFKILALALVILLAIAGVGYSVYAYIQNASQQSALQDKDSQITSLNKQIASLKEDSSDDTTTTPAVSGNVVAIRELGISITVPDSIKDLTYSYKASSMGEDVQFSTKKLTDTYKATSECTSFGSAPPLGLIEKRQGQGGSGATASSTIIKQFATFYLVYSSPQAACAQSQTTVPTELQTFKDSLSTIKEL